MVNVDFAKITKKTLLSVLKLEPNRHANLIFGSSFFKVGKLHSEGQSKEVEILEKKLYSLFRSACRLSVTDRHS